MLFATSLLLQTRFDININSIQKGGGWGGEESSHVDLNYLKRFSKFQYLQSLSNFVALSAADFSIENSDVDAEDWL